MVKLPSSHLKILEIMELQYVSDAQGTITHIIIPIEDWDNEVKHIYFEMKANEKPKQKPSDSSGSIWSEEAE
jgi:hypothetical protein